MELKKISRSEAIMVMKNNLEVLKKCCDCDTFLVISSDLEKEKFIGNIRLNKSGGINLIRKSKTCVLNKDLEEDPISVLSMYTNIQKDILNIVPKGKKYDMIIIPQLE